MMFKKEISNLYETKYYLSFLNVKNWLGRQDSNLRMPTPKTGALPLGDAPTIIFPWSSNYFL